MTTYEYARANSTSYPIAGRNKPTKIIHPGGSFKSFTYDQYGNTTSETDENGNTRRYTYDAYNRLLTSTDAINRVTTYQYFPVTLQGTATGLSPLASTANMAWTEISPSGKVTRYLYDDEHRLTDKIEAFNTVDAGRTRFTYYPEGKVNTQTDPVNRVTSYFYDTRDRLIIRIDPGDRATIFGLDGNGNVTTTIYPDGSTVSATFEGMNRLQSRTDERGRVTNYFYDLSGNLLDVQDAADRNSGFTYDAEGHLISRLGPAPTGNLRRVLETFTYDAAGNMTKRVDARNVTTTITYDTRNREFTRSYSDGTPPCITARDLVGRPIALLENLNGTNNAIRFTYNAAGELIEERQKVLGGPEQVVTYDYDPDGNLVDSFWPYGFLSYTYDNQNRLRDIYHLLYPLVSYTYYADGQRSSKAFSNGTSATYQYDSSGRLFIIDETNAPDRVYTYDRRNRPTAISSGARFSEGFQYFSDGQLQRYDRVEPLTLGPHPPKRTITQTFEYDASGNRTTASTQGTYPTDDANQYASVSGAGATSFDYDSVGNTTSRNNVQYTYDALWRVKTAKKGSTTIEFTYDALGRLSATKTNGVRRSAVYVNGHPTTWYNTAGISVEETFWGNRGNEPLFTWRASDNLEFFYHLDAQNNVTSITDWYTGAQEYYFFDPFGSPHYYAPTGAWSERTSSTINPPYLYTGQPWIASVGMYNYGARLYDPQHGRFLQPDPSFLDGGDTNLYRYVKNNPYTYVDRDGRVFETLWDLANFSLDVASLSYNLSEGSYGWAALDVAALAVDGLAALTPVLPGGAGAAIKTLRGGEEAIEAAHGVEATAEAVKQIGKAEDVAKASRGANGSGRAGAQERLRQIANDPNTSRADRGWIRQEQNSIDRGQRSSIRNPPGKDLAHTRGREAAKGYSHTESPSNLQDRDLHRTQHRFDDFGRANKERP